MWRPFVSLIVTVIIAFIAGWFAHDTVGSLYFGGSEAQEGDILLVGGRAFRFDGVDSPPVDTEAGVEARDYLQFVVADRFVWCRHTGNFLNGHYVGLCYAAFENLNRRMVSEGFARDCAAVSNGKYTELQDRARDMKRGLWADNRMPEPAPDCVAVADGSEDAAIPDTEAAPQETTSPPAEEAAQPPAETAPSEPAPEPMAPDSGDIDAPAAPGDGADGNE